MCYNDSMIDKGDNPMRKFVLQLTDEQYKRIVEKSQRESKRTGKYVSIARIIRVSIDKCLDKVVIEEGAGE